MYQYQVNDCQCPVCREEKDKQDFIARYISQETIFCGLTQVVERDLYQDALTAYYRRYNGFDIPDPYQHHNWIHRARKEVEFARYEDDRFSVLDDGSIVSHWEWIDPSKYGTVVGTYALARVAEYVSQKVQRQLEKDRQPYHWNLFIRECGRTTWEFEYVYKDFSKAKDQQMMYTFERGEEHDTMLVKYDRNHHALDKNVMEWVYSSEHGYHVRESGERYV